MSEILLIYTSLAIFRMPYQDNYWFWKAIGFAGIGTFGTRFIIQWIYSEKHKESRVPVIFWWQSLVGTMLCLAYFLRQQDSVGIAGYVLNVIPYSRNLMLVYRKRRLESPRSLRMSADTKLSICVPVYNEAENLPLLHQAIVAVVDPAEITTEIILVDDCSTDQSWRQIEALVALDPRVRGIKFKSNCGETAASDAGRACAARGQFVMTMDADLQNDPKDIPRFLETLDAGFDCVCGTRVASRGRGDNFLRIASSRIANWVRNKLSDENISDAGCTYRAFRRECLARLKLYRGLHRFIPTLLKMEGFTVTEIPVSNNPRLHGQSKYGVWNRLFKSFRDLLAIRWMKSRMLNYEIASQLERKPELTEVQQ